MDSEKPSGERKYAENEVVLMGGEIIFANEEDSVPGHLTEEMKKKIREKWPRPKNLPEAPPETK